MMDPESSSEQSQYRPDLLQKKDNKHYLVDSNLVIVFAMVLTQWNKLGGLTDRENIP